MLSLTEAYTLEVNQEKKMLAKVNPDIRLLSMMLASKNNLFAIYALAAEHSLVKAKQYYSNIALLNVFSIRKFQDRNV